MSGKCDDISTFFDGEMSPQNEARIKEHLESCAECRQLYGRFKTLKQVAGALRTYPTPPLFARKVLSLHSVRRQESFWNVIPVIPRPLSGALIALSIIIICFALFSGADISVSDEPVAEVNGEVLKLEEFWQEPSLQTYDQALQFALME